MACEHIEKAGNPPAKTPKGCEECLKTGGKWVQLRRCLSCGHVGCCDSSPGKHATGHYHSSHHPVMQSFQPGESWKWCYVDEVQA
jgi:CPA1 family monovalent cation:H+ antiporter